MAGPVSLRAFVCATVGWLALAGMAFGQVGKTDTVVVTGRADDLVGIASSANQGTVGAADIALRPVLRPAELVENIPGVIVTQHSGSGKANQYFLRGFNLDHGTDLAISVDGVPVNMVTHAHGQGYADLNFAIPELVEAVDFKKGPYYADVGDFGSAGAFNLRYYNKLPDGLVHVEGGETGYGRILLASNAGIGDGNLVYGAEYEHNDGPWAIGDDEQKYDGLLRYTLGDAGNGLTFSAMAYHNAFHSTDQIPQRAVDTGAIDRFGYVDPTDGGKTGRYSLSADWRRSEGNAQTRVLAYGVYYDLSLFSDFTYFLNDPVNGDQIEQEDRRYVAGLKASQTWNGALFGFKSDTTVGVDVRYDHIRNGLYTSARRVRLGATHVDDIDETSLSPYIENETRWTDWFRTVIGARGDAYWFDVANIAGGNDGDVKTTLFSPKVSLILGPWAKTEFYLNGGYGFHSNDARGVVANVDPATPLARGKGAELGVRTTWIPGLQSSLSVWLLDLQSELVWAGDAGDNEPSGPTRRYGVEFANFYTPVKWLTLDADYAWSHTRYTDNEIDGAYVPEALVSTFDGGLALHDLDGALAGFFGGLRLRYFGPRPLTQDNSIKSKATTLLYADAGYVIDRRWTVTLNVFNLLDRKVSDIDYVYTSRLPGEPLDGVDDIHTHPAEPREFRATLTARF